MIWARRTVSPAKGDEVQEQFESLFTKLGCPGQMMLVMSPDQAVLYASLSNTLLLRSLAGFERIRDSDLPSEASLLVGHRRQFEKYFRYPRQIS